MIHTLHLDQRMNHLHEQELEQSNLSYTDLQKKNAIQL
jgi:hypothetical protein